MKYRSRTDIISEILDAANGNNASKTKLMYKAFLSFVQMKEYLTILTESDLLRYNSNAHTFKTTEKGLKFLEAYNQLDEMIKEPSSSSSSSVASPSIPQ
jgi:predicted transcriptional regulator